MAHPTLAEQEQPFILGLKSNTGKDFQEWLRIIGESGLTERHEILNWLQDVKGLDYLPAHRLTHLFLEDRSLNGPKVYYGGGMRGGSVFYEHQDIKIEFVKDMGRTGVLAVINIPTPECWEIQTQTPLAQRDKILRFIGEQVVKDQTYEGGSYQINHDSLTIYSYNIHQS